MQGSKTIKDKRVRCDNCEYSEPYPAMGHFVICNAKYKEFSKEGITNLEPKNHNCIKHNFKKEAV